MKKTILVILAVMVAISSVFATVHAGADFDLSVKADSSMLTMLMDDPVLGPDFFLYENPAQLRFIAKPYYSNEKLDVALRFKFGYDPVNFLTFYGYGIDEPSEPSFYLPVYSFLTTIRAYNYVFEDIASAPISTDLPGVGIFAEFLKYSLIASELVDHVTFNGNWLTLSLNREEEMDFSTLATGKYVKENVLNKFGIGSLGAEYFGETSPSDLKMLVDPDLSLTLSAKHGDFSFFSFIENVGDLGAFFYNAAGVEVKFASIFTDGLKYKVSVLAQGMPAVAIFNPTAIAITPDLAVSYETTSGSNPVTYTAEADAVINGMALESFAAQFGASKKMGKVTLDSDIYVVKDVTTDTNVSAKAFRNTHLVTEDVYAFGADLKATVNFNNDGKMYLGTGFGLKANLGEETTFITLTPENQLDLGAAKLDYLKLGLSFGDTAWFGIDAEMDYFYTKLLARLVGEDALFADDFGSTFSLGITTGRKFDNGKWELNLKTGEDLFDVVGSFKMTYKLGN